MKKVASHAPLFGVGAAAKGGW